MKDWVIFNVLPLEYSAGNMH